MKRSCRVGQIPVRQLLSLLNIVSEMPSLFMFINYFCNFIDHFDEFINYFCDFIDHFDEFINRFCDFIDHFDEFINYFCNFIDRFDDLSIKLSFYYSFTASIELKILFQRNRKNSSKNHRSDNCATGNRFVPYIKDCCTDD
jgi:hypothetical protein